MSGMVRERERERMRAGRGGVQNGNSRCVFFGVFFVFFMVPGKRSAEVIEWERERTAWATSLVLSGILSASIAFPTMAERGRAAAPSSSGTVCGRQNGREIDNNKKSKTCAVGVLFLSSFPRSAGQTRDHWDQSLTDLSAQCLRYGTCMSHQSQESPDPAAVRFFQSSVFFFSRPVRLFFSIGYG